MEPFANWWQAQEKFRYLQDSGELQVDGDFEVLVNTSGFTLPTVALFEAWMCGPGVLTIDIQGLVNERFLMVA